ncbi:MAG: response regulator [Ignavibacteria bacterium]|nr:response regulator [Ignavibacteria bacterium]
MKLHNITIATQLKLGSAARVLFVIILGAIAYMQSGQIHRQTEIMYHQPLQVGRAIGILRSDIMSIRNDTKDLFLVSGESDMAFDLNRIDASKADALSQMEYLRRNGLVSRSELDAVRDAFILWNAMREETIRMLRTGDSSAAELRVRYNGSLSVQAAHVLDGLQRIDDQATKQGDAIYASSRDLTDSLNRQLILLIAFILSFSLLINHFLLRNIRTPIEDMTIASTRFHGGDIHARSTYVSNNELGRLSASFNILVDTIHKNTERSDKAATIAGIMLGTSDANTFFHSTLTALCEQTDSQVAAVYLLSDDKQTFEHYASIGAAGGARRSFAADEFEGEFGPALSTRKIRRISDIPEDTRSVFHTASGTFLPRAIITIPIFAEHEAVAVISLASIAAYSELAIKLIDDLLVTLTARVEGILAHRKLKRYMESLENLNSELEAQKEVLASQSYELHEINTELEMQKSQLNEAGRLKSNFLSNMSHELRTPLNSVIALSGVLYRRLADRIPAEESSYLEVIERNGRRLLTLINDILDISRIEAGNTDLEITVFDVNAVIDGIVRMIRPLAEEHDTTLLHRASDVPVFITSDSGKCGHILQNIIGNAAKFTEHGAVDVVATLSGSDVEITVTDTGIGISEEHLPHIYEQFRQADGGTARKYGGTGLGLAIAKKYTALLGGRLAVKSALGAGTTFTLTLPLLHAADVPIFAAETAGASALARGHRNLTPPPGAADKVILLVEDSEPALVQIQDFLEETGCRILVARDGAEALAIIAHTIPDAIILDLMLPGMDGFAVLKTLRDAERTAHIPVLVLTAMHITREALQTLKRNNIHQLIQKGDVNGSALRNAVIAMVFPKLGIDAGTPRPVRVIDGKPVILVVEDNPDNMITIKALLGDAYTVLEAIDGYAGVAMATAHVPHLIIMDIELPGMDGIAAFEAIRKDPRLRHIPVISLTASAMSDDRARFLALGFDAYVAKPVDEIILFRTINEVLHG